MEIFKGTLLKQQLTEAELSALEIDFRHYKETGILPDTFGRDELFDHPHTPSLVRQEEVRHIHLQHPTIDWQLRTIQFNRTSDIHLIYCQGYFRTDHYLLIAILKPNAHVLERDSNVMRKLGIAAESFRQKY